MYAYRKSVINSRNLKKKSKFREFKSQEIKNNQFNEKTLLIKLKKANISNCNLHRKSQKNNSNELKNIANK